MIRKATEKDRAVLDELYAIGDQEFVNAPPVFEPLRTFPIESTRLYEDDNGKVCGMITVGELSWGAAAVGSLVVRPECRGKGIASALIASVLGPANVLLWDGSTAQKKLYDAAGFKPIGTLMERK